MFIKKEG